ncbi:hypothetical protein D3C73_1437420 [compost metagenome]
MRGQFSGSAFEHLKGEVVADERRKGLGRKRMFIDLVSQQIRQGPHGVEYAGELDLVVFGETAHGLF